ncbi:MAG: YkgJ family cysteine cluster protein [Pirellulales bacterium]|nr:YkgJ family cysteine cluster protein [Pirellulales bacterium]
MATVPWYHEGLKFECSQCGDCCTGSPGYVWLTHEEIAALARRLGIPLDQFEQKFVRQVGIRKSLIEFENGDCVFFDGQARKCTVYEDRPKQCRTWPFWHSNIRTPAAWQHTCQVCPGSGRGKLHSVEDILAQSSVLRI